MSTLVAERNLPNNQVVLPPQDDQEKLNLDVSSLPTESAGDMVQLFKLLADETRLQIINYLVQKNELNVGTLCGLLHQSQPAVSHHLALLRTNGLLEMRREGKHNFYRLAPAKFQSYLDLMFTFTPNQARKIRIENRVLSYSVDGGA